MLFEIYRKSDQILQNKKQLVYHEEPLKFLTRYEINDVPTVGAKIIIPPDVYNIIDIQLDNWNGIENETKYDGRIIVQ